MGVTKFMSDLYREQTLANLRYHYGKHVDIVTVSKGVGQVAAIAYREKDDGSREMIMQAVHPSDTTVAIKWLHDISSQNIEVSSAKCGRAVQFKRLSRCEVSLPSVKDLLAGTVHEAETTNSLNKECEDNLAARKLEQMPNNVEHEEVFADETETAVRTTTDTAKPVTYAILLAVYFPFSQKIQVYTSIQNPARKTSLELVSKKSAEKGYGDHSYILKSLSFSDGQREFEIDDCMGDVDITRLFETITSLGTIVRVNYTYDFPVSSQGAVSLSG